jgi:Integrase core domain
LDCENFVRGCMLCSIEKIKNEPKSVYGTSKFVSKCKSHWSMDIVSGLPSVDGSTSYLTFVDLYSGYCVAVPLKKENSAEIADCIERCILRPFGRPIEIHSDNAANLNGPEIKKLLDFYGIKRVFSTPYSPTSHSLVEIQNKLLTGWVYCLTLAINTVNSMPRQTLLNHSPHFLLFGEEPDEPTTVENSLLDLNENVAKKKNNRNFAKLVRAYLLAVRHKRNARLARKVLFYPVGTLVYIKDFSKSANRKLKTLYRRTPYQIIAEYLTTVYVSDIYGRVSRHSKNNIKKCGNRSERLFGSLPANVKVILGDTMTPEKWIEISKDNKKIPEYLQEVEMEFVEPRYTRANMPKDTHLLEQVEDPETAPDPDLDEYTNISGLEPELYTKISDLHNEGLLDDDEIDLVDVPVLHDRVFPKNAMEKELNKIQRSQRPQNIGIDTANILPDRLRSRVRFNDPEI